MTPAEARAARRKARMTQSQLAAATGLSRGTIINFEMGRSTPLPATLALIEKVLAEAPTAPAPVAKQPVKRVEGIDGRSLRRKLDPARAAALYERGECDRAIAEACGVSRTAVRLWRAAQQLPALHPRGGKPRRAPLYPKHPGLSGAEL